uniref:PHLPP-like RA domain-containing protein n=1 Tax=Paramormyrops kingsleyae TaxID=1676925 RepID=A0A3B3RI83_9TELE
MGSAASASSLSTRSLDRKTLLRHKQPAQLQPSDREWVRSDLRRGCVHVHDRRSASCLRPVLCTLDTTAGEIAHRLSHDPTPTLYVQLHGETARRLELDEKPLRIQKDYLFKLGFKDPWRVQEEGMDSEIGSLIRFYAGKPHSIESSERIQLSGSYNVRKGKMQLPVNRWTRRQVILCGTCLIVSSVKDSQAGKMHVLPLIGGKVEEVRKQTHCLAFSSSGPQSQSYYVSFDSFTEHLRWQRQAAKMVSQRISSVDLSCCSLERLPPNLFYSQDLTHLNLKRNFLSASRCLTDLQR